MIAALIVTPTASPLAVEAGGLLAALVVMTALP